MDQNQDDMNQSGIPNRSESSVGGAVSENPAPSSPEGMSETRNEKNPLGPIIGIIVIIIFIILGGLYLWGGKLNRGQTVEEILNAEDVMLEELQTQGVSDEIVDIATDLGATDLEDIDAELKEIDQELQTL